MRQSHQGNQAIGTLTPWKRLNDGLRARTCSSFSRLIFGSLSPFRFSSFSIARSRASRENFSIECSGLALRSARRRGALVELREGMVQILRFASELLQLGFELSCGVGRIATEPLISHSTDAASFTVPYDYMGSLNSRRHAGV